MHILTPEGRTEIVGTVISVYRGEGYTCICVLEGIALVGKDEARLEEVPEGMLKIMFDDGSEAIVTDISSSHEADLQEFNERYRELFVPVE
jgi:ferric-dicitrate binding protein FerR (iron transport regulator)